MVAYGWYNRDNYFDLRLVGMDGSPPRVLYAGRELTYLEPADWSPDGRTVLAVLYGKDQTYRIVLIAVPDGSVRVLKTFDRQTPQRPRFSPDGRFIAYSIPQALGTAQHDIFLLALDGGRDIALVQHPANDVMADWVPDGRRILFGSDRSGTPGAWSIQVADGIPQGSPELLKPDMGQGTSPVGFARDGSFYYAVSTPMTEVYVAELDLATGRLLGEPTLATERFAGSNSRPDWSSDGRQLVFLSKRAPGAWAPRVICVRDSESGAVRELATEVNRVSWVRWSPDSRYLLVAASVDGAFPIGRIDLQSGGFERLAETAQGWPAVWSSDGRAIIYHKAQLGAKKMAIVWRDLAAGEEKELFSVTDPSHYAVSLALSPDGGRLAFVVGEAESRQNVLKILPVAGGEAHDLLRGAQLGRPVALSWTPDGQSVLLAKQTRSADARTELWLVPVQSGEPRRLELAATNMRDLRVHPDGRHVAYTSGGTKSDVWMMENFLPPVK
jgi:Tol biopolymer transport system component